MPNKAIDVRAVRHATGQIAPSDLSAHPAPHLIEPALLRADAFEAFAANYQACLLALIEQDTGKDSYRGDVADEGVDAEQDEDEMEAELTMAAPE